MKTMTRLMLGLMFLGLAGSIQAAVTVSRIQGFNKSWQFSNSGFENIEPWPTGYYKDYNGDGVADFLICQIGETGNLRLFTINTQATGGDKTYSNKTAGRDFAAVAGTKIPQRVYTPRSPKSDVPDLVVCSSVAGKSTSLMFERLNKNNTSWPTEKSWTLTMPFSGYWVVQWPEYSYDSDDYPDFFVYNANSTKENRKFVLSLHNGQTGAQIWKKEMAVDPADVYQEMYGFPVTQSAIIISELPLIPAGRIGNGDFDNDGKPEFFCYYVFSNLMNGYSANTRITVLNSSGNPLSPYTATWTKIGPANTFGPLLSAERADFDKDGYRDAIFTFPGQSQATTVAVPAFMGYSLKKRQILFQSTNSDLGSDPEHQSEFNAIEAFKYPGNGCCDMSGDGKVDLFLFRNRNESNDTILPLQIGLFHGVGGNGRKIWMSASTGSIAGFERVHMLANDFNYDGKYDFALVKNPTSAGTPAWTIGNTTVTGSGITLGKQLTYTSPVSGSLGVDQEFYANSTTIGAFGDMNGNGQRDTYAGLFWEITDDNMDCVRGGSSLILYDTPAPSSTSPASVFATVDMLATNQENWCPTPMISYARIMNGYNFVDNDKDSVTDDVIVFSDQVILALNFKAAGIYAASGQATTPTPADGGTLTIGQPLRWEAPDGEYVNSSFQVYLGTSQTAVTNATKTSAEYKGDIGFTGLYLPRPALTANTTYYWRIDTVNAFGKVTKGKVWRIGTKAPKNGAGDWAIYQ